MTTIPSRFPAEKCLCCRQPLTFVERTVIRPDGEEAVEQSWDCTNHECITYRLLQRGKIPTPPLSK